MKFQIYTAVVRQDAHNRYVSTKNTKPSTVDLPEDVLSALTDTSAKGLLRDGAHMSPVGVCKEFIVPTLERIHDAIVNSKSTRINIIGDTHTAAVKITAMTTTCKLQINKRSPKVIWNYAWVTESGKLVMFYISKR